MSTEYDIRVEHAFRVEDLRAAAEEAMRRILPFVGAVSLRVTSSDLAFHNHYGEAPDVPAEFLASVHGNGSPLVPEYLLATPDGEAVAEVSELDFGAYDDPDGGRRLLVSRDYYRRPTSRLLGIAVAVAAAELTGSPVVDEYKVLTGQRLASPEDIVSRLRDDSTGPSLDEAARTTLSKAGIT